MAVSNPVKRRKVSQETSLVIPVEKEKINNKDLEEEKGSPRKNDDQEDSDEEDGDEEEGSSSEKLSMVGGNENAKKKKSKAKRKRSKKE